MTRLVPPAADAADVEPVGTDIAGDATLGDLVHATVALNRALHVREAPLEPTLAAVVRGVAACTGHEAGVVLLEGGRLTARSATGRIPMALDLLQQQLDDDPARAATGGQVVLHIDESTSEPRREPVSGAAGDREVSIMLCTPLQVDDHVLGTLVLSGRPPAFTEHDRHVALLCATLAAAAIADAQRSEQLRGALGRRDVIGQAKGILMAQRKVTAGDAFDLLRRASQTRNEKLHTVAEYVIETGALPPGATRRAEGPADPADPGAGAPSGGAGITGRIQRLPSSRRPDGPRHG